MGKAINLESEDLGLSPSFLGLSSLQFALLSNKDIGIHQGRQVYSTNGARQFMPIAHNANRSSFLLN